MSTVNFLHVMSNGDVWFSIDQTFTPTGSVLATYRVNSDSSSVRLGTISGNAGSYAASGATGKNGKEIV